MATSILLIRRYVWLVDTIRRAGNISLDEINRKWADNTSLNIYKDKIIPDRTFHRHRRAIADLFDIDICYNRLSDTYYIKNEDSLDSPSFTTWMFNGLSIDNQILGNPDVVNRILFEETPGGMEHMSIVIQALSQRCKMRICYTSISHGDYDNIIIEPYFIKERLRRWYIVAKIDDTDQIGVFSFDRVERLDLMAETFEFPTQINPATYFDEVVGILLDDEYDCERIVLRMYGRQAKYIELLPIHKSQREIARTKDYIDFEFNLRPEWEFVHEILRLGYEAEILSPLWLRDEIKWQAQQITNRY